MFILGHIGITLGASVVFAGINYHWPKSSGRRVHPSATVSAGIPSATPKQSLAELIGLKSLVQFLDVRVLMVGSMMPDIVDKPLAYFGFGDGRSIAHTLLVFLLVLLTAFYIYLNHKKTWLLAVAIGMFAHLVLDSMWANPHTLLWPFYGWGFFEPVNELGLGQIAVWLHTMAVDPWVDISEGIGLAVILAFAWLLAGQKRIGTFLVTGKI